MTNERLAAVPLLAVAGLIVVVAQAHGGPFWVWWLHSDWLGWTASVAWEGGSICLWWRGDRQWRLVSMKWVATGALMMGMAMESVRPAMIAWGAVAKGTVGLEILQSQSDLGFWVSQKTLDKLLEASSGLPGWLLEALPRMIVAGAVLTMTGLYALAVVCLRQAGAEWRGEVSATLASTRQPQPVQPSTVKPIGAETVNPAERSAVRAATTHLVRLTQQTVRAKMAATGITPTEVGRAHGVDKGSMSKLMHYTAEQPTLTPGRVVTIAGLLNGGARSA